MAMADGAPGDCWRFSLLAFKSTISDHGEMGKREKKRRGTRFEVSPAGGKGPRDGRNLSGAGGGGLLGVRRRSDGGVTTRADGGAPARRREARGGAGLDSNHRTRRIGGAKIGVISFCSWAATLWLAPKRRRRCATRARREAMRAAASWPGDQT